MSKQEVYCEARCERFGFNCKHPASTDTRLRDPRADFVASPSFLRSTLRDSCGQSCLFLDSRRIHQLRNARTSPCHMGVGGAL